MRAKTEYGQQPARVSVRRGRIPSATELVLRENIVQVEAPQQEGQETTERWEADEYILPMPYSPNLLERAEEAFDSLLAKAKQLDLDKTAQTIREERNRRLAASDAAVALDRIGLDVPEGATFASWLVFLKTLGEALVGPWATYRQHLRDLPQQEGFPYSVRWPDKPEDA